jgi:glycosyltransferase involved in cell wall biosynthesis
MKILLCHAYYQQQGGEDLSFEAEASLLEKRGHDVIRFTLRNDALSHMSKLAAACKTVWNRTVQRDLRAVLRRERPEVMHCTNTFPLISPAAYYAARSEGVPVVQSLRNYRLLCPAALFLREGRVCEDCLGKSVPWPAVVHGCYRESRAASAVVVTMLSVHRLLDTWKQAVTLYFTPSEFARAKHIQGGFDPARIVVKPNFIDPDPGTGDGAGGYALFIGRLSPEKGLETLLAAWETLGRELPLWIVGDGPLSPKVQQAADANPAIRYLGRRSPGEVLALLGDAACLIQPAVWYETFGRTIIEGFARGTPAIVSRLGAMAELVADGRNGFTFEPGNAADLVTQVRRLHGDASLRAALRTGARQEYEARYTADRNYEMLCEIYELARALAHKPARV